MKQRLQKCISAAGIASRRAAEDMISAGRVTVNGLTAALGDSAARSTVNGAKPSERMVTDRSARGVTRAVMPAVTAAARIRPF